MSLQSLLEKLYADSIPKRIFECDEKTLIKIRQFKDGEGRWLFHGGTRKNRFGTFMGMEVVVMEKACCRIRSTYSEGNYVITEEINQQYVCEFCGIYEGFNAKCNKCELEFI